MRGMVAVLLVLSSQVAAAQQFDRLNALAEATLVGVGATEAVPGFEIQLMQDGQVCTTARSARGRSGRWPRSTAAPRP